MARNWQSSKHGTNLMETLARAANRGSISTESLYDIPYSLCFLDNVQGSDASDWLKPTSDWAHAYPGGPVSHEYTSIKIATLSFWMKRGQKTTGTVGDIEGICSGFSSARRGVIWIRADLIGELTFYHPLADTVNAIPNGAVNDHSAWYHIVLALDTTSGTAANRERVYVNGVEVTWATAPDWTQNQTFSIFSHSPSWLIIGAGGHYGNNVDKAFTGYLAEWHFVDGQQLAPTAFGEFHSSSGIWIPIEYEGTYGGTGHYLKFDDASNLGHDEDVHSGAGGALHYDENGLTTKNQSTDTPTNNFCTWNPLWAYDHTGKITKGNTVLRMISDLTPAAKATFGVTNGKWYWEAQPAGVIGAQYMGIQTDGLGDITAGSNGSYTDYTMLINTTGYHYQYDGSMAESAGDQFTTLTTSDWMGFALDLDSGTPTIKYYLNGSLALTRNLLSGMVGETIFPFVMNYENRSWDVNFGGTTSLTISSAASDANGYGTFEYAPPSGYYALCSKNLAEFG